MSEHDEEMMQEEAEVRDPSLMQRGKKVLQSVGYDWETGSGCVNLGGAAAAMLAAPTARVQATLAAATAWLAQGALSDEQLQKLIDTNDALRDALIARAKDASPAALRQVLEHKHDGLIKGIGQDANPWDDVAKAGVSTGLGFAPTALFGLGGLPGLATGALLTVGTGFAYDKWKGEQTRYYKLIGSLMQADAALEGHSDETLRQAALLASAGPEAVKWFEDRYGNTLENAVMDHIGNVGRAISQGRPMPVTQLTHALVNAEMDSVIAYHLDVQVPYKGTMAQYTRNFSMTELLLDGIHAPELQALLPPPDAVRDAARTLRAQGVSHAPQARGHGLPHETQQDAEEPQYTLGV